MTAEDLPQEILAQIFKSSPVAAVKELKNYSLICSRWKFSAQRELFSDFTVTSLNRPLSPNSLPYSIIAKDRNYSHLGPSIQQLHIALQCPLAIPELDPDFHLFLQQLTSVNTITFSHDSSQLFFRREIFTPNVRVALGKLFCLPSFTKLVVTSPGFPLVLIPSCIHLQQLVVHSYNWGIEPNLDSLYGLYEHEKGSARLGPRIKDLDLLGDSKHIDGFTTWLRDPKYGISLSELTHATIQFYLNQPDGSRNIFHDFGNVTHLTIRFLFNPRATEDLVHLDVTRFKPPEVEAQRLVNLRSLEFEIPETRQNCLFVDIHMTMTVLHGWIMPFLHNIPSPSRLQSLELYFITPDDGRYPQRVSGTDYFARIWAYLDAYTTTHFLALESLALYTPWVTEYEDVLAALPNCACKGIVKRALLYK